MRRSALRTRTGAPGAHPDSIAWRAWRDDRGVIWSVIRFDPAIHLYSLGMRFVWHPLADGGRRYELQGHTVAPGDFIVLPGNDAPGIPGVYDPATFWALRWDRVGHVAQAPANHLKLEGIEQ